MIHDGSFTVVLDTCVLYPASIRDILLSLAAESEWKRNLLEKREDLEEEQLDYTIKTMNKVFRDAKVRSYENLIDLDHDAYCRAFNKQRTRLTDPPESREEMRDTLENAGLKFSATTLYTSCEED